MLAHWDAVDWARIDRGPLKGSRQRLGAAACAARAGLSRYKLGPGERAMPVHVHADEEEIFYVLGGSGLSWQDGRTYTVRAGDCIVHRRNAESHTIDIPAGTTFDVEMITPVDTRTSAVGDKIEAKLTAAKLGTLTRHFGILRTELTDRLRQDCFGG